LRWQLAAGRKGKARNIRAKCKALSLLICNFFLNKHYLLRFYVPRRKNSNGFVALTEGESQMKKNLNQSGREAYEKSLEKAKELLEDKEKTEAKVDEAYKKLDKIKSGPVTKLFEDIKLMLDLLRSYINGTYREVPFGSILAILGGIIYFVTPIDLIPDFLPGGYIDDALVIGLVLKQVQSDLDAFKEWKMH